MNSFTSKLTNLPYQGPSAAVLATDKTARKELGQLSSTYTPLNEYQFQLAYFRHLRLLPTKEQPWTTRDDIHCRL